MQEVEGEASCSNDGRLTFCLSAAPQAPVLLNGSGLLRAIHRQG